MTSVRSETAAFRNSNIIISLQEINTIAFHYQKHKGEATRVVWGFFCLLGVLFCSFVCFFTGTICNTVSVSDQIGVDKEHVACSK